MSKNQRLLTCSKQVVKASVLSASTLPSRSIVGNALDSFGAMILTLCVQTHGVHSVNEHFCSSQCMLRTVVY
jgi:hypothetical protein